MDSKLQLKELERVIHYSFKDKSLLYLAMTHSSYANEHNKSKLENNERLEFLGDAVLELTVSSFLYDEYKDVNEGELTKTRASMVCEQTLFLCAQDIELNKYILLGKGEEATGGRKRPSVVSDAMEALIGAIYLDSGLESAKGFINMNILKDKNILENSQGCFLLNIAYFFYVINKFFCLFSSRCMYHYSFIIFCSDKYLFTISSKQAYCCYNQKYRIQKHNSKNCKYTCI